MSSELAASPCRLSPYLGCKVYFGTRTDCTWYLSNVTELYDQKTGATRSLVICLEGMTVGRRRNPKFGTIKSREVIIPLSSIAELIVGNGFTRYSFATGCFTILHPIDTTLALVC